MIYICIFNIYIYDKYVYIYIVGIIRIASFTSKQLVDVRPPKL